MFPAAWDPNFENQTVDISLFSTFKLHDHMHNNRYCRLELCEVKMGMIVLFYYYEARRFSHETCLVLEIYLFKIVISQ